jgi:hypothetical protein
MMAFYGLSEAGMLGMGRASKICLQSREDVEGLTSSGLLDFK